MSKLDQKNLTTSGIYPRSQRKKACEVSTKSIPNVAESLSQAGYFCMRLLADNRGKHLTQCVIHIHIISCVELMMMSYRAPLLQRKRYRCQANFGILELLLFQCSIVSNLGIAPMQLSM